MAIAGGVGQHRARRRRADARGSAAEFRHPRNRLTPVVARGADPDHLYPSFVFRMLTLPAAGGSRSPRDQLLETWNRKLDEELSDAAERAAAERLLLGDGGVYDDDLLTLRAEMFEGLESAVNGMTRDLELLNRALVRVLAPLPEP